MTMMASQITSLTVVYSIVYSGADQRKHQSYASLAFVRGIHRDRWIPRTNGQSRGKCFHLMTASCTLEQCIVGVMRLLYSSYTQCAAVKIHFSWTTEPPHRNSPFLCNSTWYAKDLASASTPSMILLPSLLNSVVVTRPHEEAVRREQDDVMIWKRFPHYWLFVKGTHRSLFYSRHKSKWYKATRWSCQKTK